MTSPAWANPYGVRKPYRPGGMTGMLPLSADHPLVAWKEPDHLQQWVNVDHAEEQLGRFTGSWPQLPELLDPSVGHGRLVIVSGPLGMGKTTLIHRCIYEAREVMGKAAVQLGAAAPNPIPVPTAGLDNDGSAISVGRNGSFASTETINTRIRREITRTLRNHGFPADRVRAIDDEEDPYQAYSEVSELLIEKNAVLFAVIPHIQWNDANLKAEFLFTCLSHARTRIVLFVEVSHGDSETASDVAGTFDGAMAVTHLALGELNSEDTWRFSRSAQLGTPGSNGLIQADRSALMAAHDEWNPSDVRELRRVFHAAADQLRSCEHPWRINADTLRPHWQEQRQDRSALRRRTPRPRSGG